jgi:chromate transporter
LTNPNDPPSLRKLSEVFFRIGNTTFGGGYVTMGMLGRELIETRQWLKQDQFDLAFALARVTPGTNLLAFCAAVGALICGFAGAAAAVMALTLPSAAVAVLFMQGFESWEGNRVVMGILAGAVAAAAGMLWATIWTILRPHVGGLSRNLQVILIAGGAFLASWELGVTPLPIILAGTLVGLLWKESPKKP